jgi:hypothetical protein
LHCAKDVITASLSSGKIAINGHVVYTSDLPVTSVFLSEYVILIISSLFIIGKANGEIQAVLKQSSFSDTLIHEKHTTAIEHICQVDKNSFISTSADSIRVWSINRHRASVSLVKSMPPLNILQIQADATHAVMSLKNGGLAILSLKSQTPPIILRTTNVRYLDFKQPYVCAVLKSEVVWFGVDGSQILSVPVHYTISSAFWLTSNLEDSLNVSRFVLGSKMGCVSSFRVFNKTVDPVVYTEVSSKTITKIIMSEMVIAAKTIDAVYILCSASLQKLMVLRYNPADKYLPIFLFADQVITASGKSVKKWCKKVNEPVSKKQNSRRKSATRYIEGHQYLSDDEIQTERYEEYERIGQVNGINDLNDSEIEEYARAVSLEEIQCSQDELEFALKLSEHEY